MSLNYLIAYFLPWFDSLQSLWLPLSLVFGYLGIIVLFTEGLNRFHQGDAELTRKIVHIGTGNVILFAWWFNIPASVGITASVLASLVALVSYYVPILPSINSVGRKSLGTFFYAVSIGILVAYFWPIHSPYYAVIGILVMAWGDGLAAIIGRRFGEHRYEVGSITKSWEGSFTMALASYLVVFLVLWSVQDNLWQTCFISLCVAIFATTLEAFSQLGIDNLTVPLGSATCAFFLSQVLSGL